MSSFYPFAINLKDTPVLVLGGGDLAYREILRLIDAGALVTIVAATISSDIADLLLTHASRARALALSASEYIGTQPALSKFQFAFLLDEDSVANEILAQALNSAKVAYHFLHQPEKSKFALATALKRGHLKIGVSTDGLCQPLERAISRRIEELFVYDFDHYSLFISAFEEKLTGLRDSDEVAWAELNHRLEGENFYLALSRKNFEEALRIVDNHMDAIAAGQADPAGQTMGASGPETDLKLPRQSLKGAS